MWLISNFESKQEKKVQSIFNFFIKKSYFNIKDLNSVFA